MYMDDKVRSRKASRLTFNVDISVCERSRPISVTKGGLMGELFTRAEATRKIKIDTLTGQSPSAAAQGRRTSARLRANGAV